MRSWGLSAAASIGFPEASQSAIVPLNFPFQIANCRAKSRNPLAGNKSNPSAAAARRKLRNGAITCACIAHGGSANSPMWLRLRPVSSAGVTA